MESYGTARQEPRNLRNEFSVSASLPISLFEIITNVEGAENPCSPFLVATMATLWIYAECSHVP